MTTSVQINRIPQQALELADLLEQETVAAL